MKDSLYRIIGTVAIAMTFILTSQFLHVSLDQFILTIVVWLMCNEEIKDRRK